MVTSGKVHETVHSLQYSHKWDNCYYAIFVFLVWFSFFSTVATQNFAPAPSPSPSSPVMDDHVNSNGKISLFDQNYNVTWGGYHVRYLDNSQIVQLVLDNSSGSGFQSNNKYLFGNFSMRIKLVHGDSSGTVTAFYLTTQENKNHDEIDFEFLGGRRGSLYRLQTNVFVDGGGDREERMHLWFDPTSDFHTYSVIWDANQILFLVDGIPIRVFKNLQSKLGVFYPSLKPMRVVASLWNGDDWATEGGKRKINWKASPFHVSFEGFDIQGCMYEANSSYCAHTDSPLPLGSWTYSPSHEMRLHQAKSFEHVRKRYVTYSYCRDNTRFQKTPPECFENGF